MQDPLRHRAAVAPDLTRVQQIERGAGEAFWSQGMGDIADDDPVDSATFGRFCAAGGAWVAVDDRDIPQAYVLVERLDDAAHVEQLSVDPRWARRGAGAALLEAADRWARKHGLVRITLTTFRDVPWNGPYYARLGFEVVEPDEMGPELCGRVIAEAASGLARWPRVAMSRPVRA